MTERAIVEAALFAAGRPLDVTTLARTCGLSEAATKAHLEALAKDYEAHGSALEIALVAGKWTMQIRASYTERARTFAPPELAKEVVKTAALIAYHQPLLQSKLTDMVGAKAYDHVHDLLDRDLITATPSGRTLELATSKRFSEFFGLTAKDPVEVKRFLAAQAGTGKIGGRAVAP